MATVGSQTNEADTGCIGGYPPDYVPTVEPGLLIEEAGNDAVAWAAESRRPTYLDPVAEVILSVIDGHATVADLADDIEDVFEVEREVAVGQLARVLRLLDVGRLIDSPFPVTANSGLPMSILPEPDW